MKKVFLKIAALLMGSILLLSATGCGEQTSPLKPVQSEDHKATVTETDTYFVRNGVSDYVVIYPYESRNSKLISFALSELTGFFNQATDSELYVYSDNDTTFEWSDSAKIISIGDTSYVQESGVGIDKSSLLPTGFAIKSKNDSVFIVGGNDNGVLFGVYEFLRYQFNWECYASDEIVMDTGVKENKIYNYDVVENPDITWRIATTGEMKSNEVYARRVGMNMESDYLINFGGILYHNFLYVIPQSVYGEQHANWFSPNGQQLCLTRDREGLAREVVEKMKETLNTTTEGYAIGFTQTDDAGWCNCETCTEYKQTYGANSASQILFMNRCWELLEPWLEENYPDREVYLYMFAYQDNTDAPVKRNPDGSLKLDENGNAIPTDSSLVLDEHIHVTYAPIYAASYHPYDDLEYNKSYNDIFTAWRAITSNMMVWSYSWYYKTDFWPYNDFYKLREQYEFFARSNVDYIFDEDLSGIPQWTDWSRLKTYLRSKISWNINADLTTLTNNFFKNYYKDAWKTMKKLFDEYTTYYTLLIEKEHLRGQGGILDINHGEYWPIQLVHTWLSYFDQAYEDIAYLKDDNPDLYSTLYDRICLDSIIYRSLCESLSYESNYIGDGNTLEEDKVKFGIANIV